MARAKQPVSIGGIEFDALIDSEEGYEAQVPEYPTEDGFSVSDTIVLKPDKLSMTLFVTDTPVTWRNRHGTGRTEGVVKQLKEMFFSKQTVMVITSDSVYSDMAITSLSIKKSLETGYAREIPIAMQKVIVTSTSTVTIPASYGKSGATGASAGNANTTGANSGSSGNGSGSGSGNGGGSDSGSRSSILYAAANKFGIV